MLSIIIPSRQSQFLQQTIDDLTSKAEGEIEIIVIFDGRWSDIPLKPSDKVVQIHQGTVHNNFGMRDAINTAVSISRGKYLMKIDEHCMVDQGYDVKLAKDCQDDWVVIPRRWRLDADNWTVIKDHRPPVDYMYVAYPYERPNDITCGLHGDKWDQRTRDRWEGHDIDETPTMQGSCYFTTRKHWDNVIGEMSTEKYGPFTQEAQEISMATWLSGGKVMVNKKTWYAHLHKGKKGKGYGFSNQQYVEHQASMERGRRYCIDYWTTTKDYKYDFEWFVNRFLPTPGWMPDWKDRIVIDRAKENR